MAWRELVIGRVPRARLEALSDALFAAGAAGLQELPPDGAPVVVRQPWDDGPEPPPPDPVDVLAWFDEASVPAAEAAVAAALPSPVWTWRDVPDVDWEAQSRAAFTPIRISDRLIVAPPWDAPEGAVVVEPGQGFGTGQHETTRQALTVLDRVADGTVATALDVGCGSGVLALAAVRLGLQASGIDVDPDAVADARANAARNGVEVDFSTTPLAAVQEPADIVLANLFAEVLVDLSADLVRLTRRHLILAGILVEREAKVRAAFDPRLGEPVRRVDGEWVCLHYEVRR